ncbi:uncharacterized protein LOC129376635 [Poeciliopsis prolifica]|uniref:uncharacterized protein LOC129376635 n=1 Tax=Poeciliopsis prolifica TaxID=188132 RepID=UPI002413D3F1|nr:uncharacterized protein LOC129376635 [Poeciliopsis prolifica]
MMKLLVQLCFLTLAASAVSLMTTPPATPVPGTPSQRNDTNTTLDVKTNATDYLFNPTSEMEINGTMKEMNNASSASTSSPAVHQGPTSPSVTTETKAEASERSTSSATAASAAGSPGSSSWAYILLVLIIIVIVVLCVILYMLRRASRTYSFDLQRPAASSNVYEPTGTFGQVYLDDLDQPVNKDVISDDLSTTPVPNGTGPQPEETADGEENALQDPPEANDPQRPSSSSSSSSRSSLSGGDQEEKKSNQMSSNNLFFDAVEETQQQNGNNNNNPSVCSSDPFVEINLDDPAWSDQLLTSPPASSVLPFSSFCSSSSSS